jgi:CRP/FNR family cyclic AMP-dependent transcriptional regulator
MSRFPLLAGVPQADAQQALALGRRRRFARGEVVFHRDDPADSIHLIVKGRFAVRVRTPLGDAVTLAIRGPGDSFGRDCAARGRGQADGDRRRT